LEGTKSTDGEDHGESSLKANLCEEDSGQGSKTSKSKGSADRASGTSERWWLGSGNWLWRNGGIAAGGINCSSGLDTAWRQGNRPRSYSWDTGGVCDDRDARGNRSRNRSNAGRIRRWARVLGTRCHNGADGGPDWNNGSVNLGRMGWAAGNSGSAARDGIIRGRVDSRGRVCWGTGGVHVGGGTRSFFGRTVGNLWWARGDGNILGGVDCGVILETWHGDCSTSEKGNGSNGETHLDRRR